jgi:hypothetical protein
VSARGIREETHAAQQVAVRDARCDDDHFPRRQLFRVEHSRRIVDPGLAGLFDLAAGGRPQLRLQFAAETPERRGGHHGLAGSADPHRQVVVGAADRGGNRRRHRPVLNQLDPCAGGADLLDQIVVARTV